MRIRVVFGLVTGIIASLAKPGYVSLAQESFEIRQQDGASLILSRTTNEIWEFKLRDATIIVHAPLDDSSGVSRRELSGHVKLVAEPVWRKVFSITLSAGQFDVRQTEDGDLEVFNHYIDLEEPTTIGERILVTISLDVIIN